jgi:hypothetical protein
LVEAAAKLRGRNASLEDGVPGHAVRSHTERSGVRIRLHLGDQWRAAAARTQRDISIADPLALWGDPFDGTLSAALHQIERLTGTKPERCFAECGYRGHGINDVSV